jgi:hypothetical protein
MFFHTYADSMFSKKIRLKFLPGMASERNGRVRYHYCTTIGSKSLWYVLLEAIRVATMEMFVAIGSSLGIGLPWQYSQERNDTLSR